MSSYSDFFGAASAGGGAPINSFAGFLVSATDNPTGYNATTGLYTSPDGTYWLKTGLLITDTGSYPNATFTAAGIFSETNVITPVDQNFPGAGPIISSALGMITSTKFASYTNIPSPGVLVREYDFATQTATGNNIDVDGLITRGSVGTFQSVQYHIADDILLLTWRDHVPATDAVAAYNYSTGTNVSNYNFFSTGGVSAQQVMYGAAITNETSRYVGGLYKDTGTTVSWKVVEYSSGFTSVTSTVVSQTSTIGTNGALWGGTDSNTFMQFDSTTGVATEYDNTQAATGYTENYAGMQGDTFVTGSDSVKSHRYSLDAIVYGDYSSPTSQYQYATSNLGGVGYSIVKTDSDTGQPLFIKIK
jgi:hypothetical protein